MQSRNQVHNKWRKPKARGNNFGLLKTRCTFTGTLVYGTGVSTINAVCSSHPKIQAILYVTATGLK